MNKRESKEQAEERAQVAPPWSHRHSLGALAPEEPNVYRSRDEKLFGAPTERNVLVVDYVVPFISLHWSEETFKWRDL
jgi:hypothetical protein